MGTAPGHRWLGAAARVRRRTLGVVAMLAATLVAQAQDEEPPPASDAPAAEPGPATEAIPQLGPSPSLGALAGRRIARIDVKIEGGRWEETVAIRRVRIGEPLTGEAARRALRELSDSGRYARVAADAEPLGDGVVLVVRALPRRILASIRVLGSPLERDDVLRAAGVRDGGDVTAPVLPQIADRVRNTLRERGFPAAGVRVEATDTDDPLRVVLSIDIKPGEPRRVERRRFAVWPSTTVPGLREALARHPAAEGTRVDKEVLDAADQELETVLKSRGWHRATVTHRLRPAPAGGALLDVVVRAGPLIRPQFVGNRTFDATQLLDALELDETDDRAPATLAERVRDYYAKRGFLDVEVTPREIGGEKAPIVDLVFTVREHQRVRIVAREYPCLTGARSASEVGSEIDSFLSEELPGSGILSSVDPAVVDATFGPRQTTGARVKPFEPNPWQTYVPGVYDRAMKHLQDLLRSEGYLSASVGPVQLLRRACDRRSPAGQCVPVGRRLRPRTTCRHDEIGLPLEEPEVDAALACVPDPSRGRRCERDAVLNIPIKLGPRTTLYDLAFEGNKVFVERALREIAEVELGKPASQIELEKARRRVLDAYAEEGFAFADVDVDLELSADHTRGRARFIISERERVVVSNIVVRGARTTNESLIRGRVALRVGQPYRRSDVRKTEERLATLGVFSAINVGLEDPYIPAKEKVVVITVAERKPQYLDVRPGFSTGEGFRITFEYGHRNLGGEAIQLTLRSQLGFLPTALILEEDVRQKYDELDVGQRLERRNSATIEFPEIGLGPLFRFSVEGIDVRDNARDFGITKDAGIVTLIFRPSRRFSATLGGSLELNTAEIFGTTQKGALEEYVKNNPRRRNTFRVPEGTTVAVAERVGFAWDRRDNPLGATSGTLVSASVEHVRATPVGGDEVVPPGGTPSVFAATTSQFLRFTNRLAGYVRLSDRGLALAASFRWGLNTQIIENSQTYPDRLFFLGGVDSLRGFLQDSLVPEDIAQELLAPGSTLTLREVVIRGGDAFINPRVELRIPLSSAVDTAIFVDAGNLWRKPELVDPTKLRYSTGSGLRVGTPIGPLAFDYGFNVERVLDEFAPQRQNQRFWEDLGAFHFSIGLF